MNKTLVIAAAVAATLALAGCDNAKTPTQTADATCPTPDEIKAALTRYIQHDYWNAGERDTWKITNVDGFSFSDIATADVTKRVVDYSGEKDVCPVRVTYTYRLHHADGRVETKEMGADKTQLFYADGFHGWTFRSD